MKSSLVKIHAKDRADVFNSRLGIVFNGEDNLKPLVTESLIDGSPTAFQCAGLYQNFIAGAGFKGEFDINLSRSVWKKKSVSDFLFDVAESVSRHQGAFIHVQYNANYEKTSFRLVPFTECRIGKADSSKFVGKIIVSKTGWGNIVKKEDRDVFNTYNPNPEVIQQQVDKAGGWANYKGQILFFKMNDKYAYPQTLLDTCYLFADTEYSMGFFYNSTVKRGFKNITALRHKKFANKRDEDTFFDNLKEVFGAENGSSILAVEDESTDPNDAFVKFDTIPSDEKPDRYQHFERSSANYIRKSFRNVPPSLVDFVEGKLGDTSGEALKMAQSMYNTSTAPDRAKLEELFQELFRKYKVDVDLSQLVINQYKLFDDGTTNQ